VKLNLSIQGFRGDQNGQMHYYFEMSREYQNFFVNITQLAGWLSNGGDGKFSLTDKRFVSDDGDRTHIASTTPVALLQLDGRTFWIIDESSYECTALTIGEWENSRLVERFSFSGYCH
jgi:hypothetical protein